MTLTAPAILVLIWPGHSIPIQPYPSASVCEQALDTLHRAAPDLVQRPGFRAWCEPDVGDATVS